MLKTATKIKKESALDRVDPVYLSDAISAILTGAYEYQTYVKHPTLSSILGSIGLKFDKAAALSKMVKGRDMLIDIIQEI